MTVKKKGRARILKSQCKGMGYTESKKEKEEYYLCMKCYSTKKCDCNSSFILEGEIYNPVHATTNIVFIPPKTISYWVREAYENSKAHGFHDPENDATLVERLALIHSELSEALEAHREGRAPTETWYNEDKPGKPEGIPSEIADVVIRCFDFCGKYGIDLEKILEEKHNYNKTRPHKHGKKI